MLLALGEQQREEYVIDLERSSAALRLWFALRHACGHALAMKGRDTRLIQDWLGHRNIQHTSHYTDGISSRFKGIWD
jgi:site-specific recombinase XerD